MPRISFSNRESLDRLENDILGNEAGLQALEAALTRSTDTLLKRKNKKRLIIDLDSTEDPAAADLIRERWAKLRRECDA